MAEIRQLKADDFDEMIALLQFAFQYKMEPERLEKERANFRPEWYHALFGEEGRMLSSCLLYPFEIWLRGRKFKMGGIAGVASWPDARRQGGVARLLVHALERMRAEGQSISMLAPFSFAFYRKYGYEMTIERKNCTLETKHLPPRRETPGAVRIVEKKAEMLRPVYEKCASFFDGTLVRDAEWWERRVLSQPGLAAVYYDADGAAQGYVLYEVAEKTFTVHDWAVLTREAETALWSYAANHDSMIERLKITVPMDYALSFQLPDPRIKQEIESYFMSRIVDVEAFVRQYPFEPSNQADELTLTIRDGQAAWNDGTFRLRVAADGSAEMARMTEGAAGGTDGGLACDIGTLTAMLAGGRRPGYLHGIGRLEGDGAAALALESRVPRQNPYLADFF